MPICNLVDAIRQKCMVRMHRRYAKASTWKGRVTQKVRTTINNLIKESRYCKYVPSINKEFEVEKEKSNEKDENDDKDDELKKNNDISTTKEDESFIVDEVIQYCSSPKRGLVSININNNLHVI